jgi:hypothetical protein
MLYQFSEFSYYSDKMIYSLMYLQQLEDKLEKEPVKCQSVSNLTDGSVQPVNRDPHGKWDVPQKPDPKDQSLRLSAPRLASRPLRVAEDSPGQTWLEVRHPVFGSGFISGDLVEPALVRVSKVISFDKGSSELTKEAEHGYRTKEDLLEGAAGRFVGTQPPFKTVVVVSYSAFDTFVIPGRTDIATFHTVCLIFASGSRLQSPALRDYLFR